MWDMCVMARENAVFLGGCSAGLGSVGWQYDSALKRVSHGGRCLRGTYDAMTLTECNSNDSHQRFSFTGVMNA